MSSYWLMPAKGPHSLIPLQACVTTVLTCEIPHKRCPVDSETMPTAHICDLLPKYVPMSPPMSLAGSTADVWIHQNTLRHIQMYSQGSLAFKAQYHF